MKQIMAVVLVFFSFSSVAVSDSGDGGSDSGSAPAKKIVEHKRVKAIYWKGGYMLSRADEETSLDLGEKKKPAIKPVTKK